MTTTVVIDVRWTCSGEGGSRWCLERNHIDGDTMHPPVPRKDHECGGGLLVAARDEDLLQEDVRKAAVAQPGLHGEDLHRHMRVMRRGAGEGVLIPTQLKDFVFVCTANRVSKNVFVSFRFRENRFTYSIQQSWLWKCTLRLSACCLAACVVLWPLGNDPSPRTDIDTALSNRGLQCQSYPAHTP